MMDLCINGGTLIDPANRIFSKLNIGITDGKISRISAEELLAKKVLRADGLVISPGFIDVHIHEENYDAGTDSFKTGIFECMLSMGVTSAIGGNCGSGPSDVKEYMEAVDRKGIPINLGMLVPHGSLRERALLLTEKRKQSNSEKEMTKENNDENEIAKESKIDSKYLPATEEQIKLMMTWAEELLDYGCLGISWGIRYIPGIDEAELLSVSGVAGQKGKLLAAHIRDDAMNVMGAAREFLGAAIAVGAAPRLSHIGSMAAYGQMEELLSYIDQLRSEGVDVIADCYPYDAFSTGIGETTYDEGFIERYGIGYEGIEIGEGPYRGKRCDEALFKKLRIEAPETITIGHFMRAEEIDLALCHPAVLIASDGFMHGKEGHPRAAGTFPRVINELVKKKKKISLFEAINKMTALPAKYFSLERGRLGIGDIADIIIFDFEKLEDQANFENPALSPKGINWVLINGEIAIENGNLLNRNLGRTLRKF